ncbi:hypothetical protein [Streptomyces corynorhini]|uniref:Uncharacterized protein n=1 Tax=Streptomyces corynorhini TaxID=2282652 RepID=A0A370BAH2_9ACTN|nr:hypothetical protein [Streptomyces corynorhini]RDG36696.1 hypothetical protein DVH02_18875 [Streptomyces corynorhini]
MESGPAIFAGTTFALFGAGILLWTGARVLHGRPVALGARPKAAITVTTLSGVVFLALGLWCFGRM